MSLRTLKRKQKPSLFTNNEMASMHVTISFPDNQHDQSNEAPEDNEVPYVYLVLLNQSWLTTTLYMSFNSEHKNESIEKRYCVNLYQTSSQLFE